MEDTVVKQRKDYKKIVKEGGNWIVVGLMILVNVGMSLMSFKGGELALNDFSNYNALDWAIWAILIIIPAVLSVIVSNSLSKEGLKEAKKDIKPYILEYENLLHKRIQNKRLRSEREYLRENAIKKATKKIIATGIVSMVVGELLFSLDMTNIIKLCINLSMWAIFGVMEYNNSFDYGVTELKEWYINETLKLKEPVVIEKVSEKDVVESILKLERGI